MPYILGFGAATSILVTTFEYAGGHLRGQGKATELEEFDRKEAMRLNRRRPIQETVAELGEGRGQQI
jgi:hypothetical protein